MNSTVLQAISVTVPITGNITSSIREAEDADVESYGSIANDGEGEEFLAVGAEKRNWEEELADVIETIVERKKTGYQDREQALTAYIAILLRKYAKEQIFFKKSEIISSCLRSVKSGRTERESLLAAKALGLTIITDPSEDVYDAVSQTFKTVITDHASLPLKAALIHYLGATAF